MAEDRKPPSRRKDYEEDVGFPVEIVGRDGVVRRYDFESSVRLYERRAGVAGARFAEAARVAAEVAHCRARIAQLRRSFFHRHGWAPTASGEEPDAVDEGMAAHVVALLQRALRQPGRIAVTFTRLPGGTPGVYRWHLMTDEVDGLVLEAIRRDVPGAEAADAMRRLALSMASRAGGDAERLVAGSKSADWLLRLTGRAEDVALLAASVPAASVDAGPRGAAWEEIVDLVHKGDAPTAYLRCRWLVQRRPWHRDAYVLGAQLAASLGRDGDAEDLAFVGLRYLPDDPELRLTRARARMGRGDAAGAAEDLAAIVPVLPVARALQVLATLRRERVLGLVRARSILDGKVAGELETRATPRPCGGEPYGASLVASLSRMVDVTLGASATLGALGVLGTGLAMAHLASDGVAALAVGALTAAVVVWGVGRHQVLRMAEPALQDASTELIARLRWSPRRPGAAGSPRRAPGAQTATVR